jgi:hypothetical protein
MNNKLSILSVLLVLQVVLILLVNSGGQSDEELATVLLDFDPARVTGLLISDSEQQVVLSKTDDDWQIAGYPADVTKVDAILNKLVSLAGQWPVATTATSALRFEVAQDNFQRRVQVQSDVEIPVLYLGTSPGFQKVHARRTGSDAIYSVNLSNFELPANVDGWLDKKLLALDQAPESITLLRLNGAAQVQGGAQEVLTNTDEGWLINGEAANGAVATTYANRFTTLQVVGVVPSAPENLVNLAQITLRSGDLQKQVTIARVGDSDDYLIQQDGENTYFSVAAYIAEQLLMTDVDFSMPETNNAVGSLQEGE